MVDFVFDLMLVGFENIGRCMNQEGQLGQWIRRSKREAWDLAVGCEYSRMPIRKGIAYIGARRPFLVLLPLNIHVHGKPTNHTGSA
jgi:hypothetical protein